FLGSGLATLDLARECDARYGFSPPASLFEAAGAGACVITDARDDDAAQFLEPDREVLVASSGDEVADLVANLTPDDACGIAVAARSRVLAHHTYERRARMVCALLEGMTEKDGVAA